MDASLTYWTPEQRWPPQCCVPAFLCAALKTQNILIQEPESVPHELGVKVSKNDANPLNLPLAGSSEPVGVSRDEAVKTIPKFLRKMGLSVGFRHVRLKEITFDLYEEVLEEALRRRLAVGIGVDCAHLYNEPLRNFLHLFRVVNHGFRETTLFDDSHENRPSEGTFPWTRLERASLAANDGLWLLGAPQDLILPYTLPFSKEL